MRRTVNFRLNGEAVEAQVAPHETLVEVLRDIEHTHSGLYNMVGKIGQRILPAGTTVVDR